MTAELILSAMLSLPPSYLDRVETLEQRTELYRPVAESIARVAKNDRQAALLVAQGWEDSKFARYILEGRCLEGPAGQRCDNGKSRGPYQVGKWCPATDLDGEARCALKAAGGGALRCRDHAVSPTHAMFIGMAGARVPCTWREADRRVGTYRMVLARLRRAN